MPTELPDPEPGRGEVRVAVRAAGVNRADLLQRRGFYPAPPGVPPDVPGLEVAGLVEAVGPGAASRPGERVMALLAGGGYADKAVVPASLLLPIPEGLSFAEAAAIPEAFLTAFDALVLQGGLREGESVLVHAAGSGVGTAALQVARAFGAGLVLGTASGPKLEAIRARGLPLDAAADYRRERFAEVVAHATEGRGADLILDLVGAAHWNGNVASAAVRARILLVGLVGGSRVDADLAPLLRKRLTLIGTVLRGRALQEKAALVTTFRERGLPLFGEGRLRPVLERTLPLAEAAAAHALLEANRTFGKVVLEVGGG